MKQTRRLMMGLSALFLTFASAAQSSGDASAATPFGTLSVRRNEAGAATVRCFAALVAPDTVLTQANCFDQARADDATLDSTSFVAGFASPDGAATSWVVAVDTDPGYTFVRCGVTPTNTQCARADDFCVRRYEGRSRAICRYDVSYYARALTLVPGHNLALAYLDGSRSEPCAAIAVGANTSRLYAERPPIVVAAGDGTGLLRLIKRHGPERFVLQAEPLWRTGAFALAPRLHGGLLLGSADAYVGLPTERAIALEMGFDRLDAALPWMKSRMAAAYLDGRRSLSDGPIRRDLPDALPPGVPGPAPAPQPGPQPKPAPVPAPRPLPEPAPKPVPVPSPGPVPDPMPVPSPEPVPDPMPAPSPAPAPRPAPEPAPAPTPPSDGGARRDGVPRAAGGCRGGEGGAQALCFCLLAPWWRRRDRDRV